MRFFPRRSGQYGVLPVRAALRRWAWGVAVCGGTVPGTARSAAKQEPLTDGCCRMRFCCRRRDRRGAPPLPSALHRWVWGVAVCSGTFRGVVRSAAKQEPLTDGCRRMRLCRRRSDRRGAPPLPSALHRWTWGVAVRGGTFPGIARSAAKKELKRGLQPMHAEHADAPAAGLWFLAPQLKQVLVSRGAPPPRFHPRVLRASALIRVKPCLLCRAWIGRPACGSTFPRCMGFCLRNAQQGRAECAAYRCMGFSLRVAARRPSRSADDASTAFSEGGDIARLALPWRCRWARLLGMDPG